VESKDFRPLVKFLILSFFIIIKRHFPNFSFEAFIFLYLVCSPTSIYSTYFWTAPFFHVYVCEMYLSVFRNEVWERDAALGKFAVHCSHSKMNSYNHKNI